MAVDGPGGAGKTTFAGRLVAALVDAPVAHTDDVASVCPGLSHDPETEYVRLC